MSKKSRRCTNAFVAFFLLALLPAAAHAQQVSVEGRLHAVWEDPIPGEGQPRLRFFVSESQGGWTELRGAARDARSRAELLSYDRGFVRVTGRRRTGGFADVSATVLDDASVIFQSDASAIDIVSAEPVVSGSQPWVTVMCRFSSSNSTPHAASWYENMLGNGNPGLDSYWRESSFENVNVSGSQAAGWYDLPEAKSAYMNGDLPNLDKLKTDCAAEADADVHFPDFAGINFQFNENIGCCSWGGSTQLTIDGVTRVYRGTWMAPWADFNVYAHEMGHGFGLPHSSGPYGNVYDSDWDVMSRGHGAYGGAYGWIPPHTIAYHKDRLGWLEPGAIAVANAGTSETFELAALSEPAPAGTYHLVEIPVSTDVFYTLEARVVGGYDDPPGSAVLINLVGGHSPPAQVVDADNDGNPNDDGAMWLPGETFRDASADITVTVEAETSAGYRVSVDRGGAPPTEHDPQIALTPTSLSYETTEGTDPASNSFTVTNDGGGTLEYTVSSNRNWLGLSRTSGSLAAGASQGVTVSVDASGLATGTQSGTITVGGNGDNAPQTVTVSVTVNEAPTDPTIAVGPPSMDFQIKGNKAPDPQKLGLQNAGSQALTWNASASQGWLKLNRTSGTLAGGGADSLTVDVSIQGLEPGTYDATIDVTGNADNSPQSVAVQLRLTKGGVVKLKKGRLTFAGSTEQEPRPEYVHLQNDGDATTAWTATAEAEWLELAATSGSIEPGASVALELQVRVAGLSPGIHSGQIEFAGGDDELPDTLQVELLVANGPGIRSGSQQVAKHLLGATTVLAADEIDYIDHVGNGNGQFDVGDLRAWLIQTGELPAEAPLLSLEPDSLPESTNEDLPAVVRESTEKRD
jgi:M6 family metalloprotease-like protein